MAPMSEWRVLVIEDEQDNMDVVCDILGHHSIQNFSAYTAEEALEMMDQVNPTLLIVDLALPQMDGWGFIKAIRQNPATAGIPAVAVTAYHSSSVAQQAIESGFNAYFPKPIDTASFVRELDRVLNP